MTEGPEDSTPTPSHRPGKEPASSNKGKRKLEAPFSRPLEELRDLLPP